MIGPKFQHGAATMSLSEVTMGDVTTFDPVNKPSHYAGEGIECIDYIKERLTPEQLQGYLNGAAMKYLHRWQAKENPLQDLKKARWYLDRLIGELE